MPLRLLSALALVLFGCAPVRPAATPTAGTGTRTTEVTAADGGHRLEITALGGGVVSVAAPAEQVWAALPVVYAELGLVGQPFDAARRLYGQPETTVRRRLAGASVSRFLECGSTAGLANADSYNVTLSIVTQVRPNGADEAQLRTEIQATARAPGKSDAPVRCGSTNALERRIAELVGQRVGASG